MCIYRIGDARNLMTFEKGTLLRLRLQPTAAGYEGNGLALQYPLLLLPDTCRQIVGRATARQQTTTTTLRGKATAI